MKEEVRKIKNKKLKSNLISSIQKKFLLSTHTFYDFASQPVAAEANMCLQKVHVFSSFFIIAVTLVWTRVNIKRKVYRRCTKEMKGNFYLTVKIFEFWNFMLRNICYFVALKMFCKQIYKLMKLNSFQCSFLVLINNTCYITL